ncbi:hypothetical protein [Legionella londiniensis]|uniref:hypothetical protein n=1 Tax=Legionella londiniensis TaxID=45068 RepID=UPI001ED9C1CB|nr:hypothetical protein [Legionella londiniensis]
MDKFFSQSKSNRWITNLMAYPWLLLLLMSPFIPALKGIVRLLQVLIVLAQRFMMHALA